MHLQFRPLNFQICCHDNTVACEKKPVIIKCGYDFVKPSFEAVLDATCERLWERHVQYSIRRIREMEEELNAIEKALDEFMGRFGNRGAGPP